MYVNLDNMTLYSFTYKKDVYHSGTQLIYNGKCFCNGAEATLYNQTVTWLYYKNGNEYFSKSNIVYNCPSWEFKRHIVKIIYNLPKQSASNSPQTEHYWTDDMVAKTIWYIVIMILAIFFYDRIAIWIVATIIWYNSTFTKK